MKEKKNAEKIAKKKAKNRKSIERINAVYSSNKRKAQEWCKKWGGETRREINPEWPNIYWYGQRGRSGLGCYADISFMKGFPKIFTIPCIKCSKNIMTEEHIDFKINEDFSVSCPCDSYEILSGSETIRFVNEGCEEYEVKRKKDFRPRHPTSSSRYWDHPHCSICGRCGTNKTSHSIGHPDATQSGNKSHCRNRRN